MDVVSPLQELACVDLAVEIGERSLEVVRSQLEGAAARDRDEAAARLLLELELEDAGKKVRRSSLAMGAGTGCFQGSCGGPVKRRNRQLCHRGTLFSVFRISPVSTCSHIKNQERVMTANAFLHAMWFWGMQAAGEKKGRKNKAKKKAGKAAKGGPQRSAIHRRLMQTRHVKSFWCGQ